MLLVMERNGDGTYRLSLFNTGDQLDKHHSQWGKTDKYQTYIGYDNVPASDASNIEYIRKMIALAKNASSQEEAYRILDEWAVNGVKIPPSKDEQDYEQTQMEGTCSAQCIMAFMRYFIMKEASGSAWEKLGLYKEIKARVIKNLISPNLPHLSTVFKPIAEKIIQKYDYDLALLEFVKDEKAYCDAVEALASSPDDEMVKQMLAATSIYERFALLRSVLRHLAHENAKVEIPKGLELLSDIIKARYDNLQDGIDHALKTLDTYMKKDQKMTHKVFENLFSFPFLRPALSDWKNRQDPHWQKENN